MSSSEGKVTHDDISMCYWDTKREKRRERGKVAISDRVDDTRLVRAKDRKREEKSVEERERKKEDKGRAEQR